MSWTCREPSSTDPPPLSLRDARALEELAHGIGGVRSLADPGVGPFHVDLHLARLGLRVVMAEGFHEVTARAQLGIRDHDAVERLAARSRAPESNLQHLLFSSGRRVCASWVQRLKFLASDFREGRGPPPENIFIILRACLNCLSSSFTSCTEVPDPRAIRRRRLPSRSCGE